MMIGSNSVSDRDFIVRNIYSTPTPANCWHKVIADVFPYHKPSRANCPGGLLNIKISRTSDARPYIETFGK